MLINASKKSKYWFKEKIMWYAIVGFFGGIFGGMGMGGGTLLIPLLTLGLGLPQIQAQGINLIAFIPMAIVTLIIHVKNGLIEKSGLMFMIIPAIIISVIFSIIANNIQGENLQKAFGVFLAVLGVIQIVMQIIKDKKAKE